MTNNKAQKTAIRQRMADTGEPYSVARRATQAQAAERAASDRKAGTVQTKDVDFSGRERDS